MDKTMLNQTNGATIMLYEQRMFELGPPAVLESERGLQVCKGFATGEEEAAAAAIRALLLLTFRLQRESEAEAATREEPLLQQLKALAEAQAAAGAWRWWHLINVLHWAGAPWDWTTNGPHSLDYFWLAHKDLVWAWTKFDSPYKRGLTSEEWARRGLSYFIGPDVYTALMQRTAELVACVGEKMEAEVVTPPG